MLDLVISLQQQVTATSGAAAAVIGNHDVLMMAPQVATDRRDAAA